MISGKTKLLGVIGHPVEHSLSPLMHNAALETLGLDYVYVPFPIKPDDLSTAIQGFFAIGITGFNVTIPHKQAIMSYLSVIHPSAKSVGAVNTVLRKDNHWIGINTDIEGFISPLQTTYRRNWQQTVAVILGNGGAARAVVAGCIQLGCTSVHVIGRNEQKLKEFRNSWDNLQPEVNLQIHKWEEMSNIISQAHLLVNTTPIGMYPNVEQSPLSAEEMRGLQLGAIAYDLIYNPSPTRFLQLAQQQGAIAINGLEMLVQQGASALRIWLDLESVPVDIMRQTLINHLSWR
ncbi:shikimate dehydrogenase [Scytonema hofmannii FACHB-248]|uniref:Shikimate dehydrogenase (NADP(+)) n=1 Tax=Scytonema hofmannii FACHB-248 TaxID=1842502 RepID=A0ABR8GXC0_9CYAN|nr:MULTISPECIES: shikimate dehydrogenase [Nostocales]MBD2607715.1 shikimate dehydrogenase [Scytonema hofmannii FACHB-248]